LESSLILLPTDALEFIPAISNPASIPLIEDDELVDLLAQASESELNGIVEILTNKGRLTCSLTDLDLFKQRYPQHRAYSRDIAAEIQRFGANTLATHLFRSGRGVKYEEIVRDVASRLKISRTGSTVELEMQIQQKVLGEMWKEMTVEQRRLLLKEFGIRNAKLAAQVVLPSALIEAGHQSGFAIYKMSVIVANAVAHVILGHGLAFATNAMLIKGLSVLLGPIGWTIAGVMAASAIGGEAYRVTIPCVLEIAMIRQATHQRRVAVPNARKHITTFAIALLAAVVGAGSYAYFTPTRSPQIATGSNTSGLTAERAAHSVIPFPPFTIHQGKIDSDGEPTTNARLCVKGTKLCFTFPSKKEDAQVEFTFGLAPKAERISVSNGGSLILFSGTFSSGGSGSLDSLALLQYGTDGKISNLLHGVYLTEQSDRRVWNLPELSTMPVFATADYNWGKDESHFSAHFFTVSAYVFDANAHEYTQRLKFVTSRKYPSLDEQESVQVLESERATIIAKLAQ